MWFTKEQASSLTSAENLELRSPIPTQMVSNGEFMPLPQTREQREVELRVQAAATENASRLGLTPAEYLGTRSAMAAAFGAMNDVHGEYFEPIRSRASTERRRRRARAATPASSSSTPRPTTCGRPTTGSTSPTCGDGPRARIPGPRCGTRPSSTSRPSSTTTSSTPTSRTSFSIATRNWQS